MVSATYAPHSQSDIKFTLLPKDTTNTTNNFSTGGSNEAKSFRDGVIVGAACFAAGVALGAAVSNMGGSSKKEEEFQSNTSKFFSPGLVKAFVVVRIEPSLVAGRKILMGDSISR
jgi:F0F1-type ATP synthase membrane subunit c/vacuolar-type H+-ATPase subunit K